jgi:hypothetical protein
MICFSWKLPAAHSALFFNSEKVSMIFSAPGDTRWNHDRRAVPVDVAAASLGN